MCGVSNIADAERKCHDHKHLFVGSKNSILHALQIQALAYSLLRRFLGR